MKTTTNNTAKLTAANNSFLARVKAALTPMFGVGDRNNYATVIRVTNKSGQLEAARWIWENLRGLGSFSFSQAEEKIAECLGLPTSGTCPCLDCHAGMRPSEYRDFQLSCCGCDYYVDPAETPEVTEAREARNEGIRRGEGCQNGFPGCPCNTSPGHDLYCDKDRLEHEQEGEDYRNGTFCRNGGVLCDCGGTGRPCVSEVPPARDAYDLASLFSLMPLWDCKYCGKPTTENQDFPHNAPCGDCVRECWEQDAESERTYAHSN